MENLRGYDNWKLASPPEGPRRCTCGHDFDDHAEKPDADNAVAALERIRLYLTTVKKVPAQWNGHFSNIQAYVEVGLSHCIDDCTCRKFEAVQS